MANPATPARLSCTTEIWPTKPVMTTSERTTPISEFTSDLRREVEEDASSSALRTTASGVAISAAASAVAPQPFSTNCPRPRRLPANASAMMISGVGNSGMPGSGVDRQEPREARHPVEQQRPRRWRTAALARSRSMTVLRAARPRALARSAAAGCPVSRFVVAGEVRPPAISAAISELPAGVEARRESPRSIPEISFSEAARVASPKRRAIDERRIVLLIWSPATMKRSIRITLRCRQSISWICLFARGCSRIVDRISIAACSVSSTPRRATSLTARVAAAAMEDASSATARFAHHEDERERPASDEAQFAVFSAQRRSRRALRSRRGRG